MIKFIKQLICNNDSKSLADVANENMWNDISRFNIISEDIIDSCHDKINWSLVSKYQILSDKLIEKYHDRIDWYLASKHQFLSERLINKYHDKVYWDKIAQYQKLSESFIEKSNHKLNWHTIGCYQNLSTEFILKHLDKFDMHDILVYQDLPKDFIKNINTLYSDCDFKYYTIKCQNLDPVLIYNWKNNFPWEFVAIYQKLSPEIIEKFNVNIPNTCWLYKSNSYKLNYLKTFTNYEIYDEYIIAYKVVDRHMRSLFAPARFQYEVGKTYSSRCNCNRNDIASFGLSAWTKEGAASIACTGFNILKVKINIKDIGVIFDNNQIRCWKQTIIENKKQ